MRGLTAAILGCVAAALAAAPLTAKSDTVKIIIKGPGLTSPVEIDDPQVRQFQVWSGPGVRVNGIEEMDGFIVDWRRGTLAERPAGLRHVEVAFYANATAQQPMYAVSYDYNPVNGEGYVYLSGPSDESYARNVASILHGPGWEGHWFHATAAWESFVRPLIARARSAPLSSRVQF